MCRLANLGENAFERNINSINVAKAIIGSIGQGARIVFLCAEPYMGKTRILSQVIMHYKQVGVPVKYCDMSADGAKDSLAQLKDLGRWSSRYDGSASSIRPKAVLACDNMTVEDEADAERLVQTIRRFTDANAAMIVTTLPENEPIVELLGEAVCFWSCDMKISPHMQPIQRDGAGYFDAYCKGIPLLVQSLAKVDEEARDAPATDPSYMEAYLRVVQTTVRDIMMHEEKQLRCAMILLGWGSMADLGEILGCIDEGLWRSLARDAPFFDIKLTNDTFECVGAHSNDCLNTAYSIIKHLVDPWPMLVYHSAHVLAKRGEYSRAAIVSLMCSNKEKRFTTCLEWSIHMIDCGEVSAVSDAVQAILPMRATSVSGFTEASCVLDSLAGKDAGDIVCRLEEKRASSPYALHASLIAGCRAVLQGAKQTQNWEAHLTNGDALSRALAAIGYSTTLLMAGKTGAAYEHLLENVRRYETNSITAGLLAMLYVLCSLLMGIVPGPLDIEAAANALQIFERSGLAQLCSLHDALLNAGRILSGRSFDDGGFAVHIQRAAKTRDAILRGFYLLVASVSDMRIGAYTRAHVRLSQAIDIFGRAQSSALERISVLFDLMVRAELGEKTSRQDLEKCKGISQSMDAIVAFVGISLLPRGKTEDENLGWCETAPCPREVHWVLNVLTNDIAGVSNRLRRIIPTSWEDSLRKASGDVDELFMKVYPTEEAKRPKMDARVAGGNSEAEGDAERCIEVSMLGGFDVYVNGTLIPSNRLERRRAKALLALLVAVPGHMAKRFVIMESIWPTYDYQSANKCVYSATSVLRSEIKSLLAESGDISLVYSSKAEATVSLNIKCICL